MGLQGMINDVIRGCDYDLTPLAPKSGDALGALRSGNRRDLARVITAIENGSYNDKLKEEIRKAAAEIKTPTLGITGTGGAGKSSLTDELVLRMRLDQGDAPNNAILSIDPARKRTRRPLAGPPRPPNP